MGQTSHGMRWPYGPVALITPFNFPLEIPALQLMGALFMGNKPLVHVDHRVRRGELGERSGRRMEQARMQYEAHKPHWHVLQQCMLDVCMPYW
jgi:hypothetical protein